MLGRARVAVAALSPDWGDRRRRRLILFSVLVFTATLGLFGLAAIAPQAWAVDATRNLAAGSAAASGRFGTVEEYLYSPAAAVLTIPATWLPAGIAIVAWLVVGVAIIVVATVHVCAAGLPDADRALLALLAVAFLPALYDLQLGNVTIVIAGAVAAAAWPEDRGWTGIPLGLVLATAPKPQLVPILVWMLIFRRRALAGAVITAATVTMATVAAVGIDPYRTWVATLRAPAYVSGPMHGNLAITSLPPLAAIAVGSGAIGATGVALRRGRWPGLLACTALGLLVSPYMLAYAPALCLVPARPLAMAAPGAVILLAVVAPVAMWLAAPVWVGSLLILAVALPASRWPYRSAFGVG